MLSVVGGALVVVFCLMSFFLTAWAEFRFFMKAISKMYFVKTAKKDLFYKSGSSKYMKKKTKLQNRMKNLPDELKKLSELSVAKLSSCQTIMLCFNYFFCCITNALEEGVEFKLDAASRWFVIGKDRLKKELSLMRLLKSMRFLKAITLQNKETKAKVMTNPINNLEIDSDDIWYNKRNKNFADAFYV